MMRRRGFTLIELVVAMAILLVLIYMAFASFSFATAISRSNQDREAVLEDMSTVLDQITKELRQAATVNDNTLYYGVQYPAASSTRDITTVSTPNAPLSSTQYYLFGANDGDSSDDPGHPILSFYTVDDAGAKHRISYTLETPSDTLGNYRGLARQYWADVSYEPCQILYSNEIYDSSNGSWTGVADQPVTDQAITNLTVIRPSWSGKVIQIVIEAMVKDASGKSGKITRMAQITLRQ